MTKDALISKVFALPLRVGQGTDNEAPIFDRNGELLGQCVDDDCEEHALALIRAVNAHDELSNAEQATFDISARLLREREEWRHLALRALPFLEDADTDPAYKEGAVRWLIKKIRQADTGTYDPTTQPFDEPFRHIHTAKAWNGGSVERAFEMAIDQQDLLISQGAEICDQCQGSGVILPPCGLALEDEIVISRTSGDDT